MLSAILSTAPGLLILVGLLLAMSVFIIPMFLPSPDDWRSSERLVVFTDWGLSIAAVVMGIGIFIIEIGGPYFGYGNYRYRCTISGLLFAFAGTRIYKSLTN